MNRQCIGIEDVVMRKDVWMDGRIYLCMRFDFDVFVLMCVCVCVYREREQERERESERASERGWD